MTCLHHSITGVMSLCTGEVHRRVHYIQVSVGQKSLFSIGLYIVSGVLNDLFLQTSVLMPTAHS